MEEMLEVMKKQLKMQKLISGLLAVMLVILLIAGGFFCQPDESDDGSNE